VCRAREWATFSDMAEHFEARVYSRAEYISDAVVHASGIGAALVGGPVLIALAAVWIGDPGLVAGMAVYAMALLAMWICSACYNMITVPDWADRLRRVDQSAIYMKIAGTYTAFIALGASQVGFLALIWAVAVAGASIVLWSGRRYRVIAIALYLGLGWAGAVLGGPLVSSLSDAGFWLLSAGGLLYTFGVGFLLWHRLPFHNTIWHCFVLVASLACYGAILVELAGAATQV